MYVNNCHKKKSVVYYTSSMYPCISHPLVHVSHETPMAHASGLVKNKTFFCCAGSDLGISIPTTGMAGEWLELQ